MSTPQEILDRLNLLLDGEDHLDACRALLDMAMLIIVDATNDQEGARRVARAAAETFRERVDHFWRETRGKPPVSAGPARAQ